MKLKNIISFVLLTSVVIVIIDSCKKDETEDPCTQQTWYQDNDGDSFGNVSNTKKSCTQPTGYVLDKTDFDDVNAAAYPGAIEICNDSIDNDGNGKIDECLLEKVTGNWSDNFGSAYTITDSSLIDTTNNNIFHYLVVGNNSIICLNDASNTFNPNLYSKFVFTNITTNNFNLCQPFYDAVSQQAIEIATDPSDTTDLAAGCGGFSWSIFTRD